MSRRLSHAASSCWVGSSLPCWLMSWGPDWFVIFVIFDIFVVFVVFDILVFAAAGEALAASKMPALSSTYAWPALFMLKKMPPPSSWGNRLNKWGVVLLFVIDIVTCDRHCHPHRARSLLLSWIRQALRRGRAGICSHSSYCASTFTALLFANLTI